VIGRLPAVAVLALLVFMTSSIAPIPGPTPDRGAEAATLIAQPDPPNADIIPRPNSGTPPEDAGDRGGALQLTVLALLVAFPLVAALVIRRQMRRNRSPAPR
jgi:hypothetical protein